MTLTEHFLEYQEAAWTLQIRFRKEDHHTDKEVFYNCELFSESKTIDMHHLLKTINGDVLEMKHH